MGKYLINRWKADIVKVSLFILSFICINVFVYYFISREKYIYFWDYYGYWSKYQYIGDLFIHHPLSALKGLLHSIRHDDLNMIPVFFLIPYYSLFGAGRLAYILSVAGMFAFPAAVLSAFLVEQFFLKTDRKGSLAAIGITLSTFLFFPQLWAAIFFGYPDVAGVVVILLIFILLTKKPFEEQKIGNLFLLGFLIAVLIMLRRWYAFWAVSFFIALSVERLSALFPKFHFHAKNYVPTAKNLIIVGAAAVGVFVIVAGPIAVKMVTTDYADIYLAYKTKGSAAASFYRIFALFGPFISALFMLALASGIYGGATRSFSIFSFVLFVSIVLLFSRVQDFGVHHFYLLMPTVVILISIFAMKIFTQLKGIPLKTIFLTCYLSLSLCQLSITFSHNASEYFVKIAPLFSRYKHYPLVRNDLREMHNLLDVLTPLIKDEGTSVYVPSSSIIFSDDILRNACSQFTFPRTSCDRILTSSHVDKRDGFPKQFLTATYIAVAEPAQYHLRPEDQRVIGILNEEILNAKGIGGSLEKLPYEFTLEDGVKVYLFKKVRPYKEADLQSMENRFLSYYPDRKDLFSVTER